MCQACGFFWIFWLIWLAYEFGTLPLRHSRSIIWLSCGIMLNKTDGHLCCIFYSLLCSLGTCLIFIVSRACTFAGSYARIQVHSLYVLLQTNPKQ
uniref:Exocyst complex component sec3 n=1 Tax=Rhizophora mucronata TaxID=61149 RepID=A0A2P2MS94_RHIMU